MPRLHFLSLAEYRLSVTENPALNLPILALRYIRESIQAVDH